MTTFERSWRYRACGGSGGSSERCSEFSSVSAIALVPCIANRSWDFMPLSRDQKLFPHFGKPGTAVFAVEEVEYGGHDLAWLFELNCT